MRIGVDIGGTKCSVVLGNEKEIVRKIYFETTTFDETIHNIQAAIHALGKADAIGISCGGPLDMKSGTIQSPPNLIGWDNVPITQYLSNIFNIYPIFSISPHICVTMPMPAHWQNIATDMAEVLII